MTLTINATTVFFCLKAKFDALLKSQYGDWIIFKNLFLGATELPEIKGSVLHLKENTVIKSITKIGDNENKNTFGIDI